uniref:Cap-specific mRNA (nucleoside-2'-O-)-methyltransferase 2 n=1 Tax=Panagrellus redivivus TaxID=6233 RepID=A0A7E4VVB7_PANRE
MDVHSSRAYLKCCDILARFPALKQRRQGFAKLRTLHLCEAPGNFVAALGDSLGEDELGSWAWRINSLNPHHEWNAPSGMLTEDALLLAAEMAEKTLYGAGDTGDVFRLTKADLEAVGKMDLVSADGSIDCTANPEAQEESVGPLISREAFLACSALEAGGNLVLKLFTFFREPTQDIVCRLIGSFDEVYLRKPSPSKPGNSEVYAVCLGFKGTVVLDKSEATLRRIASAAAYFAKCQIAAIDFNLRSVEASQYLRCQIDDIKITTATDFLQKVPEPTFWDRFAVKKPLLPFRQAFIDPQVISLSSDPFMGENWLRSRRIVSIPKDTQNRLPPIKNALFSKLEHTNGTIDFCDLATTDKIIDFPRDAKSALFVLNAWELSKAELLRRLILILDDAEKIIIDIVPGHQCGILSRFAVSVMAVLLDCFELDGLPLPRKAILMKRRRPVSAVIHRLLDDLLRQTRVEEVLCFVPLADLSSNVRAFLRYYNGWNQSV